MSHYLMSWPSCVADQGVAVAKLSAARGIAGAAAHVVDVIRSVGEGGAAAVTRAL